MIHPFDRDGDRSKVDEEAATWMWRLDCGLSPDEQDRFFEWLAGDRKHAEALARHRQNWRRLDLIADWRPEHAPRPNPDLLAPPPRSAWKRYGMAGGVLAAAASIALALVWLFMMTGQPLIEAPPVSGLAPDDRRVLEDGSTVKLNGDAEIVVDFSDSERRVRLMHGEGFFMVETDPGRPFIVEAGGLEVRALGTAFNVRVQEEALDVLVAEGKVSLSSTLPRAAEAAAETTAGSTESLAMLETSQRTIISFKSLVPTFVATLSKHDVQDALAWQHGTVSFDAKPLREIVSELNMLNGQQLLIEDPELGAMRFSGTFRTDNVEGFVRLLEVGFGVRAQVRGEDQIILRAS